MSQEGQPSARRQARKPKRPSFCRGFEDDEVVVSLAAYQSLVDDMARAARCRHERGLDLPTAAGLARLPAPGGGGRGPARRARLRTGEQARALAFLGRLLEVEVAATDSDGAAGLERFGRLPAPWRVEDFDFDAQPSVDKAMVHELATLRFLDDATNVLFIGPPGRGQDDVGRRAWAGPRSKRAIARTTRRRPTSSPGATGPRSKGAGPRPCASSPVRAC